MKNIILVSILFLYCFYSGDGALPKSIKRCPNAKDFDSCLKQVLEDIKPNLRNGDYGEGFVTKPLEPMYQASMKITGPELNISMSDLYVKGSTTYKVLSVKSDLQKLYFDMNFITPQCTYTAKYSVSQKFPVLNADIKGQGDLSGVLNRVHGRIRVRFVIIGDQVKLKKVQYKMKIDDGRFKISSLRNLNEKNGESNALFTEIANNFINSDPTFILRRIEPSMSENFTQFLKETIEMLFKDVKVSDFFTS